MDRAASSRTAKAMAAAAAAFLGSLTPEQHVLAALHFTPEGDRTAWHYTPIARAGVPLAALDAPQRRAALRLLATALSAGGYVTVATIMGLENVLDRNEGFSDRPYLHYAGPARSRDPQMYFVAVFGDPGGAAPWGWHFGGHHVSLHYTIAGGQLIAPTPCFFGADPADSQAVGAQVLRPLGAEEDLGRELVNLLSPAQREAAIISPAAPLDIVQGNRPRVEDGATPIPLWALMAPLPEAAAAGLRAAVERWEQDTGFGPSHLAAVRYTGAPKGLSANGMNAGQRQAMSALIDQYIKRLPDDVAEAERARVDTGGLGDVHFAWAGSLERRRPHYYRLQGPGFLAEYDNAQNDANHIHAVWRDPAGDFGRDLLAAHYAAAHA